MFKIVLVGLLLFSSPLLVSAEFIPADARLLAGTLHTTDSVSDYVRENFVYKYSSRQQSFYGVWKSGVGDCSEFNHVLSAYFLREQGVEFVKVRGWADCGRGRVRHEWLLLSDGSVFDVMDYCHNYKGVVLG